MYALRGFGIETCPSFVWKFSKIATMTLVVAAKVEFNVCGYKVGSFVRSL